MLACAAAAVWWGNGPAALATAFDLWGPVGGVSSGRDQIVIFATALAVSSCLVIKTVDIVLSLNKGLALTILGLAIANAAMVLHASSVYGSSMYKACAAHRATGPVMVEYLIGAGCSNPVLTTAIAAMIIFALTLLLYAQEFFRGLHDVGFIGTSLRAERKRRQGI